MQSEHSQTPHFLANKKIIIAGAGAAGPAFAIALRKQWPVLSSSTGTFVPPPTITIYERDTEENAVGREGYSLSLRSDPLSGGIQALQKLGLLDAMLQVSITGTEHTGPFAVWDRSWNEILKIDNRTPPGLPVAAMRITRSNMRRVLIASVTESGYSIWWGVSLVSATLNSSGRVRVQLSNGEVDECDLLIAADGASSRIRTQLRPEDRLCFTGTSNLSGIALFANSSPPKPTDRDHGLVLSGTGTSLFASPMDPHRTLWSVSYLTQEPREVRKQPLSLQESEEILREAQERGKVFPEPFPTLIKATDLSTVVVSNAMDKQPFMHPPVSEEDLQGKVIFIGDANHAVSPFAGNGANMALMDGWDLAEQLCKHRSLSAALAAYDALAVPRAKSTVRQSHFTIAVAHSQGWKLMLYTLLLRVINWLLSR